MTTGFVFPGQGSQKLEMLADISHRAPIVQTVFVTAKDALGYDLWDLTQHGPLEQLNQTKYTQPALLAASVALWKVWISSQHNPPPKILAGHSLGEYSALVCADAIELSCALKLVGLRGRLMQAAVPEGEGAMAAIIGLDNEQVATVCEQAAADEVVTPANYNAIGQVVISGEKTAVARAMEQAKAAGAKMVVELPVSVPSHSPLMQGITEEFSRALEHTQIKKPQIPVIHNYDVDTHEHPDDIREVLVKQLSEPVRWVETMQLFIAEGVDEIYECGPGNVLCGLMKRIDRKVKAQPLEQYWRD